MGSGNDDDTLEPIDVSKISGIDMRSIYDSLALAVIMPHDPLEENAHAQGQYSGLFHSHSIDSIAYGIKTTWRGRIEHAATMNDVVAATRQAVTLARRQQNNPVILVTQGIHADVAHAIEADAYACIFPASLKQFAAKQERAFSNAQKQNKNPDGHEKGTLIYTRDQAIFYDRAFFDDLTRWADTTAPPNGPTLYLHDLEEKDRHQKPEIQPGDHQEVNTFIHQDFGTLEKEVARLIQRWFVVPRFPVRVQPTITSVKGE